MKRYVLIILSLIIMGCTKEQQKKVYKASANGQEGILTLYESGKSFYGNYEILYGNLGKDSGAVRGEIIGDTLKGKYDYRSYAGNKKWAPFVLLKDGDNFKLGSGKMMTLMNIPYFDPATLKFSDTDFQFKRVE